VQVSHAINRNGINTGALQWEALKIQHTCCAGAYHAMISDNRGTRKNDPVLVCDFNFYLKVSSLSNFSAQKHERQIDNGRKGRERNLNVRRRAHEPENGGLVLGLRADALRY